MQPPKGGAAEGTRPRRRSTRLAATTIPLQIVRRDQQIAASATEINRYGMFIQTDEPTPLNYLVQLEIHLPDAAPFRALAWAKSTTSGGVDGVGVELFAIDPEARSQWEDFYRRQLRTARTKREPTGKHRAMKR